MTVPKASFSFPNYFNFFTFSLKKKLGFIFYTHYKHFIFILNNFFLKMASLYSKPSTVSAAAATHHHRAIRSSLTREDLLAMARNEYARQLCKFTEAQLKQHVPSCHTNSAYKQRMASTSTSNNGNSTSCNRNNSVSSSSSSASNTTTSKTSS